MKRQIADQDTKLSNNNNLLRWIQTKMNKISSSLLGNHKRVGNFHSTDTIDVPRIHKPHQNNNKVNSIESMMRILRSPIAFGYFQAYLTNEEEFRKGQYLKFYLACKDLTERHQNFTNTSSSNGSGQWELFQFRQKARVTNIWHTYLENHGDDGCSIHRHSSELVTPSENATSPEEASKSSGSQLPHQNTPDIPAEEISKPTPTHTSIRMANAIHNISRPRIGGHGHGQGPTSATSSTSRQINAPFVRSNSDLGPSKRLATPPIPIGNDHTFLPTKVIRNVHKKMERSATEGSWGPDIFTEAVDATLAILHDDVFPRFRQSRYFTKMMQREKYLFEDGDRSLPHAHNLQVRSPHSQIVEMVVLESHSEVSTVSQKYVGRHYTLEEIMEEGMLYEELLSHLKKSHSADSLLCVRMIVIFKELMLKAMAMDKNPSLSSSVKAENVDVLEPNQSSPTAGGGGSSSTGGGGTGGGSTSGSGIHDLRKSAISFFDKGNNALHTAVEEQAWLIYCYFVAVGSCYEIAIAPKCREAVMMSLVVPHLLMFAELEASAYADLSSQFRDYKNTVSYELMGRRAVATAINRAHGVSMGQKASRTLSIGTLKKYPVAASSVIIHKDLGPRCSGL